MNADGSNVHCLTRSGDAAGAPAWQPICDWIAFQGLHRGDWDVYRVSPDGRYAQRLVYDPRARDMLDDQAAGF